ncbi:TonB-dependent receptor [Gluconacetobacter tumulisoli]|nr:TonB-dependent receptor [Gluconacetobacter tumulisoli]
MSAGLAALLGTSVLSTAGMADPVAGSRRPIQAAKGTAAVYAGGHRVPVVQAVAASGSEDVVVNDVRRAFHFQAAQTQADSATHMTAETIIRKGVVGLTDLQNLAPNVTIQSENGGATTNFYVRGVGMQDLTQNNTQSIMTYIDDVAYPLSTMASGMMFDLAGVDVNPGPVGFEHGQADSGGEILIHTADPTSTWHGGVTQDIASYARSRTDLFISGPIARGLSFRIAGQTMHGGGWQYNPQTHAHLGDADEGALRAKVKWTPDSKTDIMLTGHWLQDNSEVVTGKPALNFLSSQFIPTLPYQQAEWDIQPGFAKLIGRSPDLKPSEHNTIWGADLKMSRDLGFASLQSISAYETVREGEFTDADATSAPTGDTYRNINANSFSQELRLASKRASDPLQWVVGAYYNRVRVYQQMWFDFTGYVPKRGYVSETPFHQNQQTFNQFAHLSYRLPYHVTLFGGISHEADDRQLVNLSTIHFASGNAYQPTTVVANFANSGAAANQFSGVLGAQWQATKDLMFYFKVSKGFKPGGFTANNTVVQAQLAPMKPETVMAYEAGFKADIVPNRFRLNASAFYYGYHDQQILGYYVVPSYGPLGRFVNVPKSDIWGIEFSTEIHPLRHVYLTQNFGYERGKYTKFQNVSVAATSAQYAQTGVWSPLYDTYDGTDSGIPKLTLNGSADYRFNPLPSYEWEGGLDWMYRDTQAMAPGGLGQPGYHLPAYFLLGAHMTFRPTKGPWSATVYASNLLNRDYFTTGGMATTTYFWIPGPPRFIGGRFGVNF